MTLPLQARDWVCAPLNQDHSRRLEVVAGDSLPDNMQEVKTGIKPGDRVVANALVLQSTVEQ